MLIEAQLLDLLSRLQGLSYSPWITLKEALISFF